jgi:hypothetical protein
MTKTAFSKAQSKDKKISKLQWADLVEILKANYTVKSEGDEEIFLKVPTHEEADIEVFLIGPPGVDTFHVELWNYRLPKNYESLQVVSLNTLGQVIMHIDNILNTVKTLNKIK